MTDRNFDAVMVGWGALAGQGAAVVVRHMNDAFIEPQHPYHWPLYVVYAMLVVMMSLPILLFAQHRAKR